MKKVQIMGVLNSTPDSFSDGGLYYKSVTKAIRRVKEMIDQGADIIDIGGESTRPGSEPVSIEEELTRVIPIIRAIRKRDRKIAVSIDTYKAAVAEEALKNGATMVNSIGGLQFDERLADVVKKHDCLFAIYHIKGIPRTMQTGEITYTDVIQEISQFFREQIALGIKKGIRREQFVVDPGIGFGKMLHHNLEIIKRLHEFKKLKLPILIGVSRKSHLGFLLKERLSLTEIPPSQERLEAALAETAVAVVNGASIIRTHDVWQTGKFLSVFEALQ